MRKIIFFPEKKICAPALTKIYRPVNLNTLTFLFGLKNNSKGPTGAHHVCVDSENFVRGWGHVFEYRGLNQPPGLE